MKAIILCGGNDNRLYPLATPAARPLLPLLDRELLHYQIGLLARAGVSEILLAGGPEVEGLAEFTGAYAGGLGFYAAAEGEALGSAGAVAEAADFLDGDSAVVLDAGVVCTLDLAALLEAHRSAGRSATLLGVKRDAAAGQALLSAEGGRLQRYEPVAAQHSSQPGAQLIDGGICIMEPDAYRALPGERPASLSAAWPALLEREGGVGVHSFDGLWGLVDRLESYFALSFALLARRYVAGEDTLWGVRDDCAIFKDMVYIHKTARLGQGVDLFHRAIAMRGTTLGDGCRLRNCLVLPGAQIGAGARLSDCIAGPGASVPDGAVLQSLLITADGAHQPFFPEAREA